MTSLLPRLWNHFALAIPRIVFSCISQRRSMHRDTGHEVRSQLTWYELAGALELAGVGIDGTLESLLRRQLRKLLQQVMARRHRRIDQLRVWLLLRPRADGLSRSVRQPRERIHGRGLLCRE